MAPARLRDGQRRKDAFLAIQSPACARKQSRSAWNPADDPVEGLPDRTVPRRGASGRTAISLRARMVRAPMPSTHTGI